MRKSAFAKKEKAKTRNARKEKKKSERTARKTAFVTTKKKMWIWTKTKRDVSCKPLCRCSLVGANPTSIGHTFFGTPDGKIHVAFIQTNIVPLNEKKITYNYNNRKISHGPSFLYHS